MAKVGVADLLPEPCASLDKTFQQAQDSFRKEEYERAALYYRGARLQSEEVLQKYETLLSTNPEIWLKWAREKAERVDDSSLTWDLWITLADIERQFGDHEAYHLACEKARKNANDRAFTDPVGGARDLVTFTRDLILREDTDTAHETIKEAASICENLKPASMAAYYNSQCAGLCARLGDTAGWTKHWELARQNSSTAGSSSNDPDPELAASRAYALADDPQKAFEYAVECEQKHRNRSRTVAASPRSVMYAHIAAARPVCIARTISGLKCMKRRMLRHVANWLVSSIARKTWLLPPAQSSLLPTRTSAIVIVPGLGPSISSMPADGARS